MRSINDQELKKFNSQQTDLTFFKEYPIALGYYRNNILIATIASRPIIIKIDSATLKLQQIAMLSVKPNYRKKNVAKMMYQHLQTLFDDFTSYFFITSIATQYTILSTREFVINVRPFLTQIKLEKESPDAVYPQLIEFLSDYSLRERDPDLSFAEILVYKVENEIVDMLSYYPRSDQGEAVLYYYFYKGDSQIFIELIKGLMNSLFERGVSKLYFVDIMSNSYLIQPFRSLFIKNVYYNLHGYSGFISSVGMPV